MHGVAGCGLWVVLRLLGIGAAVVIAWWVTPSANPTYVSVPHQAMLASKEKGLERKVFGRFGLWVGASVFALCSVMAQAKPSLDHQYRGPHYNTEALQLDVLDLQVQALSSPIRMLRSWKNGQWVRNERCEDLKILDPVDANAHMALRQPHNARKPVASSDLTQPPLIQFLEFSGGLLRTCSWKV
jgi:hypothetical protein